MNVDRRAWQYNLVDADTGNLVGADVMSATKILTIATPADDPLKPL